MRQPRTDLPGAAVALVSVMVFVLVLVFVMVIVLFKPCWLGPFFASGRFC
jgi:hypothetical protein